MFASVHSAWSHSSSLPESRLSSRILQQARKRLPNRSNIKTRSTEVSKGDQKLMQVTLTTAWIASLHRMRHKIPHNEQETLRGKTKYAYGSAPLLTTAWTCSDTPEQMLQITLASQNESLKFADWTGGEVYRRIQMVPIR